MAGTARARDPGGKLTLFDLFQWTATLACCCVGFIVGYKFWGRVAGLALGLAGVWAGAIVGRIPTVVALRTLSRHLGKLDTATLKEKLATEPYISHFVVQVLRGRGEPEVPLQKKIVANLLVESAEQRWQAWRTVNLCFPKLAARLRGIDPRESPQRYACLIRGVIADIEVDKPSTANESIER